MSTIGQPAVHGQGGSRALRYAVRTPLLLVHLFINLPLCLLCIAPPLSGLTVAGERMDHRAIRWWSALLVRIFGFRVVRHGTALPGGVLFVANHITWMDIELIHSLRMACFVAKSEIAGWPLVGWLASRAGTIYHQRGSQASLGQVQATMVERLRQGLAVAVFPEGTTGKGDSVRVFHARIFQTCYEAGVVAQPVALRFVRNGVLTTAPAFADGEHFLGNFLRLLGEPSTVAEVHFLEPVPLAAEGRRRMADTARARIMAALGFSDPRRAGQTTETSDDLDPIATDDAAR
jgi:1-acyl-sn-glycerol-3-phosphate acyltransferase